MKRHPAWRPFRKRYLIIEFRDSTDMNDLWSFCKGLNREFEATHGVMRVYDRRKDKEIKLRPMHPIYTMDRYGVVLVPHQLIWQVREFLSQRGIKTVRTSGTVKKTRKIIKERMDNES